MLTYEQATKILCDTNLVLLRIGLAEGCAKPSLAIGDDPVPISMFAIISLQVWERRNPQYR